MSDYSEAQSLCVPEELAGQRVDKALAELLPDYSRSRITQWLKEGRVLLDGVPWSPSEKVAGGEMVAVDYVAEESTELAAQPLDLDVVFEDEHLFVINKPPGLVVHPGAGNPDGTLLNGLLHRAAEIRALPRAGLIHRLDKDTSGLLVVARTELAHRVLTEAMQNREISREYLAVVNRVMTAGGTVDAPIARHRGDRKKMAVKGMAERGRHAVTHYRVTQRFRYHSLIEVKLETGRTHQIRVHMQHIGHPILGDAVYGRGMRMSPLQDEAHEHVLRQFQRQALHALRLGFVHPVSGEGMSLEAPPPADMQQLIDVLKADVASA